MPRIPKEPSSRSRHNPVERETSAINQHGRATSVDAELGDKYCSICDKEFSRPSELKRHHNQTVIHKGTEAKIYQCRICGSWHTQKANLKTHEKTHFEKNRCGLPRPFDDSERCNFECSDSSSMARHIDNIHISPLKDKSLPVPESLLRAREEREAVKQIERHTATTSPQPPPLSSTWSAPSSSQIYPPSSLRGSATLSHVALFPQPGSPTMPEIVQNTGFYGMDTIVASSNMSTANGHVSPQPVALDHTGFVPQYGNRHLHHSYNISGDNPMIDRAPQCGQNMSMPAPFQSGFDARKTVFRSSSSIDSGFKLTHDVGKGEQYQLQLTPPASRDFEPHFNLPIDTWAGNTHSFSFSPNPQLEGSGDDLSPLYEVDIRSRFDLGEFDVRSNGLTRPSSNFKNNA